MRETRRTVATILVLLNVAPRVAMDFMGWSDPSMMLRYQHVTKEMRRQVADGIDGLLWAGTDLPGDAPPADRDAAETGVDDDGESELN